MVGVAQLAERQVVVLDVVGSSPIVHPKRKCRSEGSAAVKLLARFFRSGGAAMLKMMGGSPVQGPQADRRS